MASIKVLGLLSLCMLLASISSSAALGLPKTEKDKCIEQCTRKLKCEKLYPVFRLVCNAGCVPGCVVLHPNAKTGKSFHILDPLNSP